MSDEENPSAVPRIACSLPHCDELANHDGRCTSADTPHFLCDSCFCGYALSQLGVAGAFQGRRTLPDGSIVSEQGELPCHLFLINECDCACLPVATLERILSTDPTATKAYESAKQRIAQAQADEEQASETNDDSQESAKQGHDEESTTSPLEKLHEAVLDALSRGSYVACPRCGQDGQKNDACMHMRCTCGTRYCYCCGRERGYTLATCSSDGTGCDYPSALLESHPGWNQFSRNHETAGLGALHEFHRRRMAYFVRLVKIKYSDEQLWDDLRREYPDLLKDVPTDGRKIDWNHVDTAQPPLFGRTKIDELEWYSQEDPVEPPEPIDPLSPKCRRLLYTVWYLGCLITIGLLCCFAVSDSQSLRTAAYILVVIVVGTGFPVAAMALVEDNASLRLRADGNACVLCSRVYDDEPPYLALAGRWNRFRLLYWYLLFGGIASACFCLAYKRAPRFIHGVGAFLLAIITLSYFGIVLLVNKARPRHRRPLPQAIKARIIRFCVFAAMFSTGIGVLVGAHGYKISSSDLDVKDKVMTSMVFSGLAGGMAELIVGLGSCPRELAFCTFASWFTLAAGLSLYFLLSNDDIIATAIIFMSIGGFGSFLSCMAAR